ncbi:O-methyltransferase [Chitinasiproducens palmae]|uniref:Predicted O-methyltransferase YrrM n=1 Tax=Chitinasiproducens palmae TaxID=1770053 RepID=A0A1H2PPX4_9BURK|nr:class I SAM-dependent methyltransferase [Chitinasiproducens palmae]SDV48855.1 Predicted O-methyltransferase YrrM [Chitinasiproducens palmae]
MDERIQAVLDTYHRRIDDEKLARQRDPGLRDSLSNDQLLRAVGPQTGQLLNVLARSLRAPTIVEIGTSFGYSGIWLAEAARATGGRVVTMEMYAHKSRHAEEMACRAGLDGHIVFQVGDALELLEALPAGIDFVLLDLWKDLYEPCLELFYPKLNPGAIVVADNMIQPAHEGIASYGRAVRAKPGMTSVQVPVGSGLEISRFEPTPAYGAA